mmetsp:Transcript_37274/g.95187  ORF Transcript_37274/g.95187 Transcript_37274/m.95187 type:complete len:267 (-) Transcript_37274:3-803(-)
MAAPPRSLRCFSVPAPSSSSPDSSSLPLPLPEEDPLLLSESGSPGFLRRSHPPKSFASAMPLSTSMTNLPHVLFLPGLDPALSQKRDHMVPSALWYSQWYSTPRRRMFMRYRKGSMMMGTIRKAVVANSGHPDPTAKPTASASPMNSMSTTLSSQQGKGNPSSGPISSPLRRFHHGSSTECARKRARAAARRQDVVTKRVFQRLTLGPRLSMQAESPSNQGMSKWKLAHAMPSLSSSLLAGCAPPVSEASAVWLPPACEPPPPDPR